IQTEAGNAPKTNSAKPTSPHISQLILSVVSQCKHRGGISMAELKQMLAAGGYDVAKNNRRVNIETKRLVNNETLRRRMAVTSHKLARKTRKAAAKSHKQRRKTTKGRKSPKPAGKKRRPATNRGARVRKAPRKAQKTRRRRPNRVQNRHKKQARRRLPKSKLRSRKSTYYYH
uniref:H15 domain-containing protein n=1 Tax=Oreochromis niloticus TaxID=8128 RepID=I3K528_ORENI